MKGESTYLEVKTPLFLQPSFKIPNHINFLKATSSSTSTDRLTKHFGTLQEAVSGLSAKKAFVCLVYMYNAEPFRPPPNAKTEVREAVTASVNAGVEVYFHFP